MLKYPSRWDFAWFVNQDEIFTVKGIVTYSMYIKNHVVISLNYCSMWFVFYIMCFNHKNAILIEKMVIKERFIDYVQKIIFKYYVTYIMFILIGLWFTAKKLAKDWIFIELYWVYKFGSAKNPSPSMRLPLTSRVL